MVTTHPIQYQTPWLQLLSARADVDLHVFFAMLPTPEQQGSEFGVAFAWDLPLLEGLNYTLMSNQSPSPSVTTFRGCDTPDVYQRLREGSYDAVIVNGWGSKTALQALLACRRLRLPCIVRGEANGLRARGLAKRLAHRLLLSQYAAYLSIGQQNRRYYLQSGCDERKIFDTPYCVDNQRFASQAHKVLQTQDRSALRRAFGLCPDSTTFLFSGKLIAKKRPLDVIAALARVAAKAGRVQLLIVGDGPLRDDLKAAAVGLPVVFAGFLNQGDIARAYAASDCLVLPSDAGETWGLVVNEAMASGLPAIVSDQVGCANDLVRAGETGQVFPCSDVEKLAEWMQISAGQPTLLAHWGERAERHVATHYCFERVVDGVVAALAKVVSASPARPPRVAP